MMHSYGRTTVHELVGDFIVYRNLEAADERLPRLNEVRAALGLAGGPVPRKSEPDYGRVVAHLLRAARALDAPGRPLRHLVLVGDTRLLDGTAFANLCAAGGWPGLAFIAAERAEPLHMEVVDQASAPLVLANRWAALAHFDDLCRGRGIHFDEDTAVVLDLDKTTIGARGRNDRVVDDARLRALRRTVARLLGNDYDPAAFLRAYGLLNTPPFHPFTADNQDYLAYICLVLGSGLMRLEPLVDEVQAGRMASFQQFIAAVDERAAELPDGLRTIHDDIVGRVRAGDPTPFKAFRYLEYRTTVERFGSELDGSPPAVMLAGEICITQEVRAAAHRWRRRGALLFALSDKPDEASFPPAELVPRGFKPLHRAETHAVGE